MYSNPIIIKFSEEAESKGRIQIIRLGTFSHAYYGKMEITKKKLQNMIKNFNDDVRGIEIAVNYSHFSGGEAAGWITKLEMNEEGLFADVDWNEDGQKAVDDKKFKYISIEFDEDWEDPETNERHGATLLGAALTNIPFIKKMDKVLSEFDELEDQDKVKFKESIIEPKQKGNKKMTLAEILEATKGLSESEKNDLLKGLGVNLDEVKQLKEKVELAERKAEFAKMLSEKKVVPAQEEAFINGDMKAFAEASTKVNLNEAEGSEGGNSAGDADDDKSSNEGEEGDDEKDTEDVDAKDKEEAEDKVQNLAEKMMKDDKTISFEDAVSTVLDEHPKLAKKYAA